MGHGAPDWWSRSHIDIIGQALAYLTQRPMYGAAKSNYVYKQVDPNTETTLITVIGKGMIYGGLIQADVDYSIGNDIFRLYVDDEAIVGGSFYEYIQNNLSSYGDYCAWISCFDDKNHVYAVNFRYGLTFEEKIKITYQERNGKTPYIYCDIIYTLMLT